MENNGKEQYTLWNDFVRNRDKSCLTPSEIAIMQVFINRASLETQEAYPSFKRLEKEAGVSHGSIVKGIPSLRNRGLLIPVGERPKKSFKATIVYKIDLSPLPLLKKEEEEDGQNNPEVTVTSEPLQPKVVKPEIAIASVEAMSPEEVAKLQAEWDEKQTREREMRENAKKNLVLIEAKKKEEWELFEKRKAELQQS